MNKTVLHVPIACRRGNTVRLLATFSLLLAGVGGCMSERSLPGRDGDLVSLDDGAADSVHDAPRISPEYRPLVGQLPVQNGALDGSIGYVAGLRPESEYETSGWGEPSYASVYTVGWGENGAAMTIVEVEGGLHHEDLQPGAHLEYDLYDPPSETPSLFAYVVGCAGEELNSWEFDQIADHTSIDVSAHPDDPHTLILDYEARFTDWETGAPSFVVGSVEVVRTPS